MAYYRFEEAKEPNFELFHKKCSEMFSRSFCHYFNHCMQNLNNTLSLNMGNASSNDQAFMRSQTLLPAKGGLSKKLTFCPHIIASTCKHWIFPLTEDFKVPAILKKFISKEVISEVAILNCLGRQAMFMCCHSIHLKIGRKKKTCN